MSASAAAPSPAVPDSAAPEHFELISGDGLRLRGEVWGAGPRALTFLHGSGLTVASYRPAFSAFSAFSGRARVHALDARGHGGSECPAAFSGYELPLDDLRRLAELLAERLGVPLVLAGHSYGALLSMRLAAEAPRLVSGLILLEPLIPWRRGGDWKAVGQGADAPLIEATRGRRESWPNRAAAEEWLRSRSVYRAWTDAAFAGFAESGLRDRADHTVALACPPWLEAAVYMGRPGPEIFEWAARSRRPAVIVRGSDSNHCSAEGAEDLANAYTIGAVLTVKGGHTFPMEQPEAAGRALALALEILERSGAAGNPKSA